MFNPHIKFEMSTITCNKKMKGKAIVLSQPLGDIGVTYTVHLWLVGKRVVDFLLTLVERLSPTLTVEALWPNISRNCAVWKGGLFEHKFHGEGGSSTNEYWRKKTRLPGLSRGVVCVILRLAVLIQFRRVTDTQTHIDKQTENDHGYYPRRASFARVKRKRQSLTFPSI